VHPKSTHASPLAWGNNEIIFKNVENFPREYFFKRKKCCEGKSKIFWNFLKIS
jgi:hypothetical protein